MKLRGHGRSSAYRELTIQRPDRADRKKSPMRPKIGHMLLLDGFCLQDSVLLLDVLCLQEPVLLRDGFCLQESVLLLDVFCCRSLCC
jgi:hypothetical protein